MVIRSGTSNNNDSKNNDEQKKGYCHSFFSNFSVVLVVMQKFR